MKLKSILLTATFTAFAAAFGAHADDTHHPQDKAAEAAKAEKTEAKKPVEPHSHAKEKTGMPMSAPSEKHEMSHEGHEHMMKHDHTKDKH